MAALKGAKQLKARMRRSSDGRLIMGRVGLVGVREAKQRVPRKTGNLGRTIRLGDVTDDSVEIRAGGQRDVGYAAYVEFGTRAHVIRPRRAKVLAWGGARTLGGRLRKGAKADRFARKVMHPGTRPRPYLGPGLQKAAGEITDVVVDLWNEGA